MVAETIGEGNYTPAEERNVVGYLLGGLAGLTAGFGSTYAVIEGFDVPQSAMAEVAGVSGTVFLCTLLAPLGAEAGSRIGVSVTDKIERFVMEEANKYIIARGDIDNLYDL